MLIINHKSVSWSLDKKFFIAIGENIINANATGGLLNGTKRKIRICDGKCKQGNLTEYKDSKIGEKCQLKVMNQLNSFVQKVTKDFRAIKLFPADKYSMHIY